MPARSTAIVDPAFPDRLRALREDRGLSYRQLGQLAHYSHVYLWQIETGARQPTAPVAGRLDQVLGAAGTLAALVIEPTRQPPLTVEDTDRLDYVAQHPRRVDAATVQRYAALLAELRHREDVVGAGPLLAPVREQLDTLAALVREAHGPLRGALVDVAAQWAQFAGWLHTSAQQPTAAEAWLDRALVWAAEAGNSDMQSTALSFKGHLAWTLGQVGPMVGLTEAARRYPGVYVGQVAYDALQAARGHALIGEVLETLDAVAESVDLAEQAREHTGPVPPWHYYRTPGFFALERGRVYRYLADRDGYGARAAGELRAGLGQLPAEARSAEWVASYLVDLVAVLARAGDTAAAGEALEQIRQVATATGSLALAGDVERLACRLGTG